MTALPIRSSIPFDQINSAMLARYPDILFDWFPAGKMHGKEFTIGNLDGTPGDSLSINTRTGVWAEFHPGGPRGPDPISLYAALYHGGSRVPAARELGAQLGLIEAGNVVPIQPTAVLKAMPETRAVPKEEWTAIVPPPGDAEAPKLSGWDHVATYYSEDGELLRYVVRREAKGDRKKLCLPLTYGTLKKSADDKPVTGWHYKHAPEPRHLFGLDRAAAQPHADVWVLFGEKKAAAFQAMFPDIAVVTWTGGDHAVDMTDWTPLSRRNVVIWRDADQSGADAESNICSILRELCCEISTIDVSNMPENWDAGDAIAEGWTAEQVMGWATARLTMIFQPAEAEQAPDVDASEDEGDQQKQNQNPNWYTLCQASSKGTPLGNHANIMLALREDPAWADIVRYDEMARVIMLMKPLPKTPAKKANGKFKPRPWQDNDATVAQEWFQLAGLTSAAREAIYYAIEARARENASHPVQNYLNGLSWDGVPRIGSWLAKYIGTEDTAYTQAIGRLFLISSVARILDPGCKVDYMLILEGEQGESKSTACKVLGGEWFSDNMPHDVSSKDASQHLRGKWFIEVAEMHAMSKSETTALKAFLTRTVEVYRPSYGRAEVYEPRQCVFIGTTNRDDYLDDETGARRFWPVRVGSIDIDGLKQDREQLFAEAVHCYHAGEQWYPSRDFEAEFIRPQQEARYNVDAWDEPIMKWLNTQSPVTLSNGFTVVRATPMEIATLALGLDVGRVDKAATNRIRKVLSSNGWHKDGPRDNAGNRPWYPGSFPRQKK